MNSTTIRRPQDLESLTPDQLHDLTVTSVENLATSHLQLGNCLLAVERSQAFTEFGCSCLTHYASMVGVGERLSREVRRVARCLEALPLTRAAAEEGTVPWSNLREVVRKAIPETEVEWLAVAQKYNSAIVEDLVSRAHVGEEPGKPEDVREPREPKLTELRLLLTPEVAQMFQQATRLLSWEASSRLSASQVFELVLANYLLDSPTTEAVERLKEGIRKDLAAEAEVQARADQQVREELAETAEAGSAVEELAAEDTVAEEPVDEGSGVEEPDDPRGSEVQRSQVRYETSEATRPAWVMEPPPPPWAAVAARESRCPGTADLTLASRGRIHWENDRLQFKAENRSTTSAQRNEILRRDCYGCSTPGCPHQMWLHIHHIVFYCRGGATVPSNLVLVCSSCHKNIHEGRLKVEGTAPGGLIWSDRRGRSMRELRSHDEQR